MCSRLSSFDIIPHRPICRNLFLRKIYMVCAKVKRVTAKLLVATVVLRQIAIAHAKLWRAKNRSVAFCVKVEPYAQNQKVCSITVTLAGFILRKTLPVCAKPTMAVLLYFIFAYNADVVRKNQAWGRVIRKSGRVPPGLCRWSLIMFCIVIIFFM